MEPTRLKGRMLVVAGSDSSGGAGIQADIKTATALGGYAATALTAVTVQSTQGVTAIHPIPAELVAAQMLAVLDDIGADVVKTGMLARRDVIEAVAQTLVGRALPLVLDPVMVAKGGARLIEASAVDAAKALLFPQALLITPNVPEAEHLAGFRIRDVDDMTRAAQVLQSLGPAAVLVKGGHLDGASVHDVLVSVDGVDIMTSPRLDTRHTHGTGCTLASAIAMGLAQGLALGPAVRRARAYVQQAIATAPGLGHGHGPLNHVHTVCPP